MSRARGQAGFSLVELMVVVAFIGIIAAIGIPSFKSLIPRTKLRNNASMLANEIASLRMQAIAKSMQFQMVFSAVDNSYTLQKSIPGGWAPPYNTVTLYGTDITSVTGFTPTPNILVIENNGTVGVPLGSQGSIVLETPFSPPATQGDVQKQILVQPTGRVIVQKRMIGGNWVTE